MSPSERKIPCDRQYKGLHTGEDGGENKDRRWAKNVREVGTALLFSARCCRRAMFQTLVREIENELESDTN